MSFKNYSYKISKLLLLQLVYINILFLFVSSATHAKHIQKRTYYGTSFVEDQAPYVVAIQAEDQFCTGALINGNLIITAGHCVQKSTEVNKIKVFLGLINVDRENSPFVPVAKVKYHPGYEETSENTVGNDLVLLELKEPVEFSNSIAPIELEDKPWNAISVSTCMAMGYGRHSQTRETGQLHGSNVIPEHGPNACGCANLSKEQKMNLVCLSNLGNDRICFGDMGGPLVCDNKLVAVAVKTVKCANHTNDPDQIYECAKDTMVDAYIYINSYLQWMKSFFPGFPPNTGGVDINTDEYEEEETLYDFGATTENAERRSSSSASKFSTFFRIQENFLALCLLLKQIFFI